MIPRMLRKELRVALACSRFSPNGKVANTEQGVFGSIWSRAFRNRRYSKVFSEMSGLEVSENTVSGF